MNSPKLMGQLRARLGYKHYLLATEKAYCQNQIKVSGFTASIHAFISENGRKAFVKQGVFLDTELLMNQFVKNQNAST